MKKRVLLIDESLTVQKVVALTLDRNRYSVVYAKSRSEAMKEILQSAPDLILVSDQVSDITVASFPKEVESWVGRERKLPPMVLISGQDVKEMRHYKAVLRKPFSPQALQAVVVEHARSADEPRTDAGHAPAEEEDSRLQKIFNDAFADEAKLTRETFEAEAEDDERTLLSIPAPRAGKPASKNEIPPPAEEEDDVWGDETTKATPAPPKRSAPLQPPPPQETAADLWGASPKAHAAPDAKARPSSQAPERHEARPAARPEAPPARPTIPLEAPEVMGTEDSVAYKAVLEKQVETELRNHDLEQIVDRLLGRLIPPIVERLVQERLDKLMKDQEQFVELKP